MLVDGAVVDICNYHGLAHPLTCCNDARHQTAGSPGASEMYLNLPTRDCVYVACPKMLVDLGDREILRDPEPTLMRYTSDIWTLSVGISLQKVCKYMYVIRWRKQRSLHRNYRYISATLSHDHAIRVWGNGFSTTVRLSYHDVSM